MLGHLNQAIKQAEIALQREWFKRCPRKEDETFSLAGKSQAIIELHQHTRAFSESDSPVLLLGQTGTGKTTVAKSIHEYRNKALKQTERPFFGLNIAALNENTVASELFGHEKGSFSDAKDLHRGFVELANQGTLFLDEIADASLAVQALLLKAIDEGKFFRVGGTREMKSHFKLICATHKDLKKLSEQGLFRYDLYMRLSTFILTVPSLQERKDDIPAIVEDLLPAIATRNRVPVNFSQIPEDYLEWLKENVPEGNVRGIDQQLSRLLVLSPKDKSGRVNLKNWRSILKARPTKPVAQPMKSAITYNEAMNLPWDVFSPEFPGLAKFVQDIEQRVVATAKTKFGKNSEIARKLKMSESATSVRVRALGTGSNDAPPPNQATL